MIYTKDNGKYLQPVNFADTFGLPLTAISLQLINSCRNIYKDKAGEYIYYATSFDAAGNVSFTKQYR